MFKTYKDKLVEIEVYYNDHDFETTIVEASRLTEKALHTFFNQFHSFLTSREDVNRYLEFEKANGERYANFLRRPTIGVAIGYYTQLLEMFPKAPGLNQEIRRYLNQANQIRNANLHNTGAKATDEDAAAILDSLEKILVSTGLIKVSLDAVGIPIKLFLVYKSIWEKFQVSKDEDDFRKIISDAKKILPELLSVFLNKLYRDLPTDKKEALIDLYSKTIDDRQKASLQYYVKLCLSIDMQGRLEAGSALQDALEFIAMDSGEGPYNRRQTRHYVTALEIVAGHADNRDTSHFLDFADSIKKRYLAKHSLTDRDRIVLEEKAKELSISKDLARQIEDSVIRIIEKELILFQTLSAEEAEGGSAEKKGEKPATSKPWYYWAGAAAVVVIAILSGFWLMNTNDNNMPDYEVAYLSFDVDKALELLKGNRPDDDMRANYYYILSSFFKNGQRVLPEVKAEYQQMLKSKPGSPVANLSLGMIYSYEGRWREERDSAWLLIDNAERLGVSALELNFVKADFYMNASLPDFQLAAVEKLEIEQHTRAKTIAARAFLDVRHDTARAISLFKQAIDVYPGYGGPYLNLSSLYLQRKQFDSAKIILAQAKQFIIVDGSLVDALAQVHKQEGRFDLANKLFRDAIATHGASDVSTYIGFGFLLMEQDSIDQCLRFLDSADVKFPKDRNLQQIRQILGYRRGVFEARTKKKVSIPWVDDEEKAREMSKRSGKPILASVHASWSYWSSNLEQNIFTDSSVALLMESVVPLKVNGMSQVDFVNRYKITWFPAIMLLDAEGNKKYEVSKYRNVDEFRQALGSTVESFKLLQESDDPSRQMTQVNNSEDARIIAKSRNLPLMVVVGDERSPFTKRLQEESMKHPMFKVSAKGIVYLYLDKGASDPVINSLNPETYPSIFFLNAQGNLMHSTHGYQPGETLASVVTEVTSAHKKGISKLSPRINWYYDVDEAKTYSLLTKKDIYQFFRIGGCPDCDQMEETFAEARVIRSLTDSYVALKLDASTQYGMNQYSASRAYLFPFSFILGESGTELFGVEGFLTPDRLIEWLDIKDNMALITSLGVEKHRTFVKENSLAKNLLRFGRFQSAYNILSAQHKAMPDYADIVLDMASAKRQLQQQDEALVLYEQAIEKGATLTPEISKEIVLTFLSGSKLEDAPAWIERVSKKSSTAQNKALLHFSRSIAFEYQGDLVQAASEARIAAQADNGNDAFPLQEIKMFIRAGNIREGDRAVAQYTGHIKSESSLTFYKSLLAEMKGDQKSAKALLNVAASQPGGFQWSLGNWPLFNTNNYYKYEGSTKALERDFLDLVKANNTNSGAHYILSLHYSIQNDFVAAGTHAAKALELEPDPAFKFAVGYASLSQNEFERAAEILSEAEQEMPEDYMRASAFLTEGLYYQHLNNEVRAKELLLKAASHRDAIGAEVFFKDRAAQILANGGGN